MKAISYGRIFLLSDPLGGRLILRPGANMAFAIR